MCNVLWFELKLLQCFNLVVTKPQICVIVRVKLFSSPTTSKTFILVGKFLSHTHATNCFSMNRFCLRNAEISPFIHQREKKLVQNFILPSWYKTSIHINDKLSLIQSTLYQWRDYWRRYKLAGILLWLSTIKDDMFTSCKP